MSSKVSLVRCDTYQQEKVDQALQQAINLLGGFSQFVKPGQKVLIKPNVLMECEPDSAITTHPSLVAAVVKMVVRAGGIALVGDSPGNALANINQAMEKTGIRSAVEAAGGKIVTLHQDGIVEIKSPSHNRRIPSYKISKLVLEADLIINLPKLKTHNLTLYTGAIKNLFGVVPGFYKAQFHIQATRPRPLAELLVDILEITKPKLNIFDSIVGMEGNGPAGGTPRKLGVLLASTDAVSADAVGSYLIGFNPLEIDTTVVAYQRKLGEANLPKIEIRGEDIEKIRQKDWKHSATKHRLTNSIPEIIYNLARPLTNQIKVNPEIDQEKCNQCLVCVNNCPTKTIHYSEKNNKVLIDLRNCINCFCCHELCQFQAVKLKPSFLVRLFKLVDL
jgi:uncharacterized protein (DUF362 family)/NAD-dependent dihydropyrimidine dehydrogenase PreA subunit